MTAVNVLADFDDNLVSLFEAGVPLDKVILYCAPNYKKILVHAFETEKILLKNCRNKFIIIMYIIIKQWSGDIYDYIYYWSCNSFNIDLIPSLLSLLIEHKPASE